MQADLVIRWTVILSCLSALVTMTVRVRPIPWGWCGIYLGIASCEGAGCIWRSGLLTYSGLAGFVVLVLLPGLISRVYYRYFIRQRYAAAGRMARALSWLHPFDGWRQQPILVHALELGQQGNTEAAIEIFQRFQFQDVKSPIAMGAMANLFRVTQQWEEALNWHQKLGNAVERHAPMLALLLRARGETGDLAGLIQLYERHRLSIARLIPVTSRDICRLMLFAFCGRRDLAERLFSGSLAVLPSATRDFWLATADMAAGATEPARQQFERLRPVADAATRIAIERRFSQMSLPSGSLDSSALRVLDEAAREQIHEENFGARRSLFSKQARATQILIVLNVLMFLAEIGLGGSTNQESLFRLGAIYPPAVRAGEWWRLLASLFLHFGPLHIGMNMLALWLLGPFVEFAVGFRRYLTIYLVGGIGSMATVTRFATGERASQIVVGASGCIMALVGATGALMLRGWAREKALAAKRQLAEVVAIIALQTAFDSMIPEVSMTAHLSGAAIGFAITFLLRDRLVARPAQS